MPQTPTVQPELPVAADTASDPLWRVDFSEIEPGDVDQELETAELRAAGFRDSGPGRRNDNTSPSLWRALYHFNLYRLVLGVGLLALSFANAQIADFGSRNPTLFLFCSLLLAGVSLFNMMTISQGIPSFRIQASGQIVCDILLITLLMYASGGVSSGLGLLLLVSIAAAGVVLPGKTTIAFAGVATVAVFAETLLPSVFGAPMSDHIPGVALLGVALFATAFFLSILAQQIRSAEDLAEQRAEDLMTLARVNAHIVKQLESGVLITDSQNRIYFTNDKARRLLGIAGSGAGAKLDDISPALADTAQTWRIDEHSLDQNTTVELPGASERFSPRFVRTDHGNNSILMFLDSVTLTEKKAQQIKLASLGRLTAAISHEIRNPLAALSHAAELLSESNELTDGDRRLVDITIAQSDRINTTIKSVLQFSRREKMARQTFDLLEWCEENALQIAMDHDLPPIAVDVDGESVNVNVNSAQLQQVLGNLCDNAIRHSPEYQDRPLVDLEISRTDGGNVQLDIIDHGEGIDTETAQHLFEPFFTTHVQGTGLGLYICRELCQANGASLNYIEDNQPGSRFRVIFDADPGSGKEA